MRKIYKDELYHYGVKGMKWGVRRAARKEAKQTYRREMGSAMDRHDARMKKLGNKSDSNAVLKSLQQESKDIEAAKTKYKQAKQDIKNMGKSQDHVRAKELKKKSVSEMSNAELRELNNRMQLESQYKNLKRQNVSAGQKFIKDVMYESSKNIASEYTKKYAKEGIAYVSSNYNSRTFMKRNGHA